MSVKKGSRIFITGAASGLGRAIALHYARKGWSVCVADVHEERGQETLALMAQQPVKAAVKDSQDHFFMTCDVSQDEHLQQAVDAIEDRWGGVDIVVNNAGVAQVGDIDKTPMEDWKWIVEINLMGVVRGCHYFTPMMKRQKQGHFVNVASLAGLLAMPGTASYNVTKAGVVALTETLREELAPYGIGCSAVCPAFFQTNLAESLRTPNPKMEKVVERLLASSSITAEDIAQDIDKAVQKNQLWVLPHTYGKLAWMAKKYLPLAFHFSAQTVAKKNARYHKNSE